MLYESLHLALTGMVQFQSIDGFLHQPQQGHEHHRYSDFLNAVESARSNGYALRNPEMLKLSSQNLLEHELQ